VAEPVPSPTAVRVLSWNVLCPEYALPREGRDPYQRSRRWLEPRDRFSRLVHRLRTDNADLVFLQEVPTQQWERDLRHVLRAAGYEAAIAPRRAPTRS